MILCTPFEFIIFNLNQEESRNLYILGLTWYILSLYIIIIIIFIIEFQSITFASDDCALYRHSKSSFSLTFYSQVSNCWKNWTWIIFFFFLTIVQYLEAFQGEGKSEKLIYIYIYIYLFKMVQRIWFYFPYKITKIKNKKKSIHDKLSLVEHKVVYKKWYRELVFTELDLISESKSSVPLFLLHYILYK